MLAQRGLVSQDHQAATAAYVANPPLAIKHMVDKERESLHSILAQKDDAASQLVPALASLFQSESPHIPRLQYFEGAANVRTMLHEYCRDWQQSIAAQDYTWWGYQDHQFVETYRDWLDYYWSSMAPSEEIKLFSNKSPTERSLKGKVRNRTIKLVPKQYQFSSTIWILGEYVVTIMLAPIHYAFQLKDQAFAANQRKVFQLLVGKQKLTLSPYAYS